jgi:aminoglycoside phosphotransferase family enzyme/predicted kinase
MKGGLMNGHVDPRLLEFLRDPASYPHRPREVTEVHTHASMVFLVPPLVYKIKKPVDFGFLDFSTLEKRRHFCQREVELNSRLAPGIYQGVVPLTRQADAYAFSGSGRVAEYAVKMTCLEPAGFLNSRIKAGTAGEAELERVTRTLADFYRKQPSPPELAEWGGIAKLRISTDENFAQTRDFIGNTLSGAAFGAIRGFTENCYHHRAALFDRRVVQGWIRDCHGDLHLDHIHVTDDALHIYDCIEFNDRFRHLDVASDAAFLAMDLDFHDRPELASFFIRRLAELLGDPEMESLMDFYKCYRAYVRGKVESLHSIAEPGDAAGRQAAAANARRYFQLALQYAVAGAHPRAITLMGRVASGKSTLAAALARELGWPLVSSDVLRKTLTGVPLHERGDAASRAKLYATGMTERTYHTLIEEASQTLRHGRGVILDATFSKRALRDSLRARLGDENLIWVLARADEKTTLDRLRRRDGRHDVVSDARLADHAMLDAAFEPPDELPARSLLEIATGNDPARTVQCLLTALATHRDSVIAGASA